MVYRPPRSDVMCLLNKLPRSTATAGKKIGGFYRDQKIDNVGKKRPGNIRGGKNIELSRYIGLLSAKSMEVSALRMPESED